MSKLSLIQAAANTKASRDHRTQVIHSSFAILAEQQGTTAQAVAESVTHILANIAATAQEGTPLKLMHLDSIAAFMAGVEAIANALPNAQDTNKVQNTIKYLQAAKVGADGFVTTATAPIAQAGIKHRELMSKYSQMVKDYTLGASRGQANGAELVSAAKQLQTQIDQAMRVASSGSQNRYAATSPSSVGTNPSHL